MVIHLSIFALIIILSAIFENRIKGEKVSLATSEDGNFEYKSTIVPWLLLFVLITIYAGLRTDVNDTTVYREVFKSLVPSWDNINQILEDESKDKGFYILQNLFKMYVSSDYHHWFFFIASIESIVFIHNFRRYSIDFMDAMFFFFASTLYYNYFSMMRQWLAISIVFAGFSFLRKKKFFPYLLICLIAAQIHNSAYIIIFVYFLVQGTPWGKRQNIIVSIFALAVLFMQPILNVLEDATSGTTYDYVVNNMNSSNGSSFIRPIIAILPVVLGYLFKNKINNRTINICVNMSIINFLLSFIATFTSGLYVVRLSTYMNIYNVILYPYLLNVAIKDNDNARMIKVGFYVGYSIFYIYQMWYSNSFPYYSNVLGYFG